MLVDITLNSTLPIQPLGAAAEIFHCTPPLNHEESPGLNIGLDPPIVLFGLQNPIDFLFPAIDRTGRTIPEPNSPA